MIGYVEPRPGIPPTPQHTLDLVNEMKRQNVKLILVEPYFDLKTPNAIGAPDRRRGSSCCRRRSAARKTCTDYFKLFDYDVNLLADAARQSGAK